MSFFFGFVRTILFLLVKLNEFRSKRNTYVPYMWCVVSNARFFYPIQCTYLLRIIHFFFCIYKKEPFSNIKISIVWKVLRVFLVYHTSTYLKWVWIGLYSVLHGCRPFLEFFIICGRSLYVCKLSHFALRTKNYKLRKCVYLSNIAQMLAPNPYLIHNKWFTWAARHSVGRILI